MNTVYSVRHKVSETQPLPLSHDMTKVTFTPASSKYKDGSGPELSSCDKHHTSNTQATLVHVPSLAQRQELLLLILSLMLLPKRTTFRKCDVGCSSLLIIIV